MRTLYVSDLDGTLLTPEVNLSDFTIKTLNELIENGLNFTYATARSLKTASKLIKGLDLKLPAIVNNGTFIEKPGKIIVANEFSKEERDAATEIFEKNKIYPFVYAFVDKKRRTSWHGDHIKPGMDKYIQAHAGDDRFREVFDYPALFAGKPYYYTAIGKKEELEPCYTALKTLGNYNITFQEDIYEKNFWLEVMPKAATKASGIETLKKMYGFDKVVSFGDSLNDLDMFKISDKCYAVSNAFEEVKKAATGIIESNREDAVAKFLLKTK